jgi:hypothetical protein
MSRHHEVIDERTERELAALADGSLPPEGAQRLLTRVQREPRLAAELATQRRALELLAAAGGEPAPTDLHDRVALLSSRAGGRRSRVARPAALGGALAGLCAVVIALALVLTGGHGAAPTLGQAVALTQSPAQLPTPRESVLHDGRLEASVQGVSFPYWNRDSGWRPAGARRDSLAGRFVETVFYRSQGGRRVGYAIVAGSPLSAAGASPVERDGVEFHRLRMGGANAITWVERGHSCVLSGNVSDGMLLHLATL